MSTNSLTYSIATEWLRGSIGHDDFSMHVLSGGGRGRKGGGAEHDWASYNVFRKEKTTSAGHTHGGPLPPGIYVCRYTGHHPKFHECIYLEQTITSILKVDANARVKFYDRDAFYIHGRGPHGSDGCIVPEDETERGRLNKAIKNAAYTVLLIVKEEGLPLPASRETLTRNV